MLTVVNDTGRVLTIQFSGMGELACVYGGGGGVA